MKGSGDAFGSEGVASDYAPPGYEVTLSKRWFIPHGHGYAAYVKDGGYEALRDVLRMPADAVIDQVKQSNLRGRGGAGFPTGMKWSFVPQPTQGAAQRDSALVVNADESEPGTYKDRYILARDPHSMLEGSAIAAYAIGAHTLYIYIRGEFGLPYQRLMDAVEEAYQAGVFGSTVLGQPYALDVTVHRGAGAYICGEETALLESLEGKIGRPRLKPPFPAVVGAFGRPTLVHNVETLACVPLVFSRGVAWFLKQGCPKNGGPKLVCVSGHVERPGVYEVPNGYPCDELIGLCGGVWKGRALKAVIPGGSSTPVLKPQPCQALAQPGDPAERWPLETQVPLDFDHLRLVGSMLGSAGMMVLDDHSCMVRALRTLACFYAHESCGQCTPCREGTGWIAKMLTRLEEGRAHADDLQTLTAVAPLMMGTTICPLSDALAMPVLSYWAKFQDEFEAHLLRPGCSFPQEAVSPAMQTLWEEHP